MSEYVNRAMELAKLCETLYWRIGHSNDIEPAAKAYDDARTALRSHLASLPASGGEPVATVFQGGLGGPFGKAVVLVRWEDAAMDLPDGEHKLYTAPPARSAALIAAVEALELCVNLLSIWKNWTPAYCTANKDFESLPEVEKARAALSLCRAELDPTIAGEGER